MIDNSSDRASALNAFQLDDTLPIPDGVVSQIDRQHVAGFYAGVLVSGFYNLYVGLGSLNDVDFTTVVTTFPAGTSSGTLVGFGFAASKSYTLVLRPEIAGLETPDISAQVPFDLDSGGEWTGLLPDPVTGLSATLMADGVVRLTFFHRIFSGATPTNFVILFGTNPTAVGGGGGTALVYTGPGKRYTVDIDPGDEQTYWFKVFATATALISAPVRVGGITPDQTAPAAPAVTIESTWRTLQ